jgi:hypothetical protein
LPVSNALKGTLILLDANATTSRPYLNSSVFIFQFNPETLTHTFTSGQLGANVAPTTQGSVAELFNLTFDLESDDLDPAEQTQTTRQFGLHPALAVLETMTQQRPAAGGQPELPVVVFCWGSNRVVPVQVVSMNFEEKAFDATLNPTKATVHLCMRALALSELKSGSAAYNLCTGHLNSQKTLVTLYKRDHPQLDQSVSSGSTTVAPASAVIQSSVSASKIAQKLKKA